MDNDTTAPSAPRRGFLRHLLAASGVPLFAAAGTPVRGAQAPPRAGAAPADRDLLPRYARAAHYRSLKQSSYDRTGGNADYWKIAAGDTREVFTSEGPGVITHIWFTISAPSVNHLKEIVLRMYWDGQSRPSVETPVGDFFGLNLGQYAIYQSAFLTCSPGRSLNSYFAMPFRKAARMTVTNESRQEVGAFYSNIDYQLVPALPDDALYFHAQYRQSAPPTPSSTEWSTNGEANKLLNPDGRANYVYAETRGRGHLMGVTLGVLQNQDHWMGEGDDMIFVDDETRPAIVGTGSEDYFLGSWNFGGRENARPFDHLHCGAPYISIPERTGGRYLCYRWHTDNPVTFTKYLKHTMEHGHANHRADNFYSACYWYQAEPFTDFPALPPADARIPNLKTVPGPGAAQPAR